MAGEVLGVGLPVSAGSPAVRPPHSLWQDAAHRLLRNRAATASLAYVGLLVAVAVLAPVLAPRNALEVFPGNSYRQAAWVQRPDQPDRSGTWEFPLGTDSIGRDVLSRLIYGTRTSLVVGFLPMAFTVLLGTVIGLVAGYRGGAVDALLMRLAEIVSSFPALLIFIVAMAALKDTTLGRLLNGFVVLFLTLSLVSWVGVARLVRGQALAVREMAFIEASRALGLGDRDIVLRHVLPNSLAPVIVTGTFLVPGAILTEAALSYLGIGLRPATDPDSLFPVSWGNMILDGKAAVNAQPWLLIAPALAIASVTLAFTFIGDGLRDALDPRDLS